jgi:hypothetical protein
MIVAFVRRVFAGGTSPCFHWALAPLHTAARAMMMIFLFIVYDFLLSLLLTDDLDDFFYFLVAEVFWCEAGVIGE